MKFFKTQKLYRATITKPCNIINPLQGYMVYKPSLESLKLGNIGYIPISTRGWIVKNFNKKYFRPDIDQAGIDLYTPYDQPHVLIPYFKVEGKYQKNDKTTH